MTPKFRRIAVFVGAAALAGGAGDGVAAQHDAGRAGAAPTMARPAQGGLGGRPDHLSALAAELGVSESRLRAAIEATRPSGDPGSAPSRPPRTSDMAAALASELGLSVDKVQSAVDECVLTRSALGHRGPRRRRAGQDRPAARPLRRDRVGG